MPDSYTFGDSTLAVDRLALLAEVFRPATARLLTGLRDGHFQLVVDLGCGPGYTTVLARELLAPERVVGVESSPAFAEEASWRVGANGEVFARMCVTPRMRFMRQISSLPGSC